MGIPILKSSKIFVACPANVFTGGPELLHQLAYHLINDLNVETFMYYYDFDSNKFKTPVHNEYEIYNVPYVLEMPENEDNKANILIVSEVLTSLSLLTKYKNIRKGIWFLSLDNYYLSRLTKEDFFIPRAINKISKIIIKKPLIDFDITSQEVLDKLVEKYDYRKDPLLKLANFYMVNSYRGLKWFSDLEPLYYLPDYYVNIRFIEESCKLNLNSKKNIVAYNPKKGYLFTKKIIKFANGIKFTPIENMTREDVIDLLKEVKVYIDFGHFPGPERIPKEAAILGCCVITGKRGCAAFYEDVPIPDDYRFEDKKENIPKIIEKIKDCFENFEERYKDFEYYRKVIKDGPQKFKEDLKKIFIKMEDESESCSNHIEIGIQGDEYGSKNK